MMKKVIASLMAAVMLACAMSTSAFGAETSKKTVQVSLPKDIPISLPKDVQEALSPSSAASTEETSGEADYEIDLNDISDKEWKDSKVALSFLLNGNKKVNAYLSDTSADENQPHWNKTMGRPVLLNLVIDEVTQKKMPITFVPIRLIIDCISTCDSTVSIDWVTATSEEAAHAVIHTTNGDVKLYLNATQIEYTDDDGVKQVYEETTYRFPDDTPIPLCLMRDVYDDNGNYIGGRIYVPVRAISTFLLESDTVSFNWRRANYLQVIGNTKGTVVEKTYGLNMSYYNAGNWSMNWLAMPNLMAALEGTDWALSNQNMPELPSQGVYLKTESSTGATQTLRIEYVYNSTGTQRVLKISGFWPAEADEQLRVLNAAFTDLICDADRETLIKILAEISDTMSVGWTPTKGYTDEAKEWRSNYSKTYTLSETKVVFSDNLSQFSISSK